MNAPSKLSDEVEKIIEWIEECESKHRKNENLKGQKFSRKYHMEACREIVAGIRRREYLLPPEPQS